MSMTPKEVDDLLWKFSQMVVEHKEQRRLLGDGRPQYALDEMKRQRDDWKVAAEHHAAVSESRRLECARLEQALAEQIEAGKKALEDCQRQLVTAQESRKDDSGVFTRALEHMDKHYRAKLEEMQRQLDVERKKVGKKAKGVRS